MATSQMRCTTHSGGCLTRRAVLAATGVAGVATLAACAGESEDEATTTAGDDASTGEQSTSDGATDSGDDAGDAGGDLIATVSDIPVGGAVAATTQAGDTILITQPADGEIYAFSAVCTHQGCEVEPGDGELDCPCHGSVFDLTTGEPLQGPASDPLPAATITVADNGDIFG